MSAIFQDNRRQNADSPHRRSPSIPGLRHSLPTPTPYFMTFVHLSKSDMLGVPTCQHCTGGLHHGTSHAAGYQVEVTKNYSGLSTALACDSTHTELGVKIQPAFGFASCLYLCSPSVLSAARGSTHPTAQTAPPPNSHAMRLASHSVILDWCMQGHCDCHGSGWVPWAHRQRGEKPVECAAQEAGACRPHTLCMVWSSKHGCTARLVRMFCLGVGAGWVGWRSAVKADVGVIGLADLHLCMYLAESNAQAATPFWPCLPLHVFKAPHLVSCSHLGR